MKPDSGNMTRRSFIGTGGALGAGAVLASSPLGRALADTGKRRVALVGTGVRGVTFWGKFIQENYGDVAEFVGLCDINPGRLEFGKSYIGVPDCPTFDNFDEMLAVARPDLVMVVTVDSTHDEFIVKALAAGIDVVTEKPMTTAADKCQSIVNAARASSARLIMGFNYRYGSVFTKVKELLSEGSVGDVTSVDFNWYLNNYHGASYFRRWHGIREKGGTLLLHKAAHHFDLLNWWIGSDPVEVHAYGALEHYGHNNAFRSARCTGCEHKDKCAYFWDISQDRMAMDLYKANEHHDGYIRDACLWRKEIDIFDKMAVQIKYANNVQVAYSLTTYSPYEGFRLAFNG
ncbi:Gfo/Idh/MocA family protein, partial [Pseudomonadota bacterium]